MNDRWRRWATGAVALVLLGGCGVAPSSTPLPSGIVVRLSADAIGQHLAALDAIARNNGGIRAAGTPGYDASVDYVVGQLRDMGYVVTMPEVDFSSFAELPGSTIEVMDGPSFEGGADFHAMIYSGGGDLSARVATVGYPDSAGGKGGQGCERSDFDRFPAGAIALVPPGPCFRRQTVENAEDAGAVAVVAVYSEWHEGEARRPTLLSPEGIEIPVLSATEEVGDALQAAATDRDRVSVHVDVEIRPTVIHSVVAESTGDPARVVMLGAHLDSVLDGPGINDDGSGVAALLEIARAAMGNPTGGRIRFGFWAAEEYGLLGSRAYVEGLPEAEREALVAYLNLDMLGSPNAVPFVYAGGSGPPGSEAIADYLMAALEADGIGAELLDLGGASDHAPFADAGILTGGVFSGATEPKTDAQAANFGGQAGQPMDACYHLVCDTLLNVDVEQVATFGQVAAGAAMALARGELLP
jgi:Zn-dependent M28 family amino/carboxypeptidase